MSVLRKLSDILQNHMAIIVLIVAAVSLFFPSLTGWIQTSWITPLLMIVMFGMGLTLSPEDILFVFKRPKDVIIGVIAQFTIMPLLAFALGKVFSLPDALMIGVILVGTCPGGTSSNVITYLSDGDVPLSVSMTSISTLLAPILTPLLTKILLGATVEVDPFSMFLSIVQVVMLPLILGFIVNKFFTKQAQQAADILPLISVTAIVMIVASVVSANADQIRSAGLLIIGVAILHNVLGYLLGFGIGKVLGLPLSKKKAISIEVGMQNSGLATSLATTSFAAYPMAAVPGAVFSVWHNISGAILAQFYKKMEE